VHVVGWLLTLELGIMVHRRGIAAAIVMFIVARVQGG
jgi:hypothetical protein